MLLFFVLLFLSGQTFPKKGQTAVVHYVGESAAGRPYKDLLNDV